ncbi:putative alpha-L-rhamnosidase [Actinoplanes missouriensis 431]|uniref:alpha-L-rhamnosidase n=1 Tax=Actinoplanes missouriensis (strain ATCC 14538 / DSM 43046 / CBS 188.64 / JCM 3121 / NBRC 102363 / NCIMB 12654 / NRRL B-3342 / UNCC 431) TaxID=512565 RepID=I0GZ60_ACTM4|nr:alpha-L-rhamnosidase [Actinoplanes missouriensis]BAL86047.1 putative alpha-L-rhamnosidase [Actinoplanes missouriensis 431]
MSAMNGTGTRVPAPRIEHHDHPLGVGERSPRLSWQVQTVRPGWRQTAYEIEIDGRTTGRIKSADSVLVPWPGPALTSRQQAEVRVRVWAAGETRPTPWSESTTVEAGLLEPEDWAAGFVGSADISVGDRRPVLLRRDFTARPGLLKARLYATACGLYELQLNGDRIGDDVLAPGWTSYHHRLPYQTYDVTGLLRAGANTIDGWLADGWWRGEYGWNRIGERYGTDTALLAQLELHYTDGSVDQIVTDGTWTWAHGPITASSIYDGEHHDARIEPAGWTPVQTKKPTVGELTAPAGPPVRRTGTLPPASVTRLDDGTHLIDFGQNLAGRLRITVTGPTGTEIGIRHAEVLEQGRLCTRPIRTAVAHDVYVLAGTGTETWEPRFTYHGFRYAEITGWPGDLDPADVVAVVCHDDMHEVGTFSCSDPLVERLHENVRWSMRGNFVSVPTDCPQRDERLGWTGDLQVFAPTAAFLYDATGSIADWLTDVTAETGDDGLVPLYVPHIETDFTQFHCAVWGDVTTVVPLVLFDRAADLGPVLRGYDTARTWVDACRRLLNDRDVIAEGLQLGDWLDPAAPPDRPQQARTDPYLVATAYLAHSARLLARQAELIGKTDDAFVWHGLADRVTAGFRREFVTAAGRCVSDTQTAYALALCFDLLTAAQRVHAGERLAELVREGEFRIGTGFAGTPLILDALTVSGHLEEAYRLLLEKGCPSWLYPVTMGATTIWERWDSMLPDGLINPGNMTSFNHYALGAVADWLHRTVAGLAPAAPGYRTLRVRPRPGGGLSWAAAQHRTPYGDAAVHWQREGSTLQVEVIVPPNCDAQVELPGQQPVSVSSGTHTFSCTYRPAAEDPIAPLPPRRYF